jgi:hypothetical protein
LKINGKEMGKIGKKQIEIKKCITNGNDWKRWKLNNGTK